MMQATAATCTSNLILRVLLAALLLAAFPLLAFAFPGGTGGCTGGRYAVAGPHISRPFQTGPIGNARLQLVLDDRTILRGGRTHDFTVGVDHTLTLQLIDDAGKQFRGFLFRMGRGFTNQFLDTTDALAPVDLKSAVAYEHCVIGQGVGGLTHTNSDLKTNVTGILRMDEPANSLPLDVNVVIQNRGLVSEFYYQQFTLNAVAGPPTSPAPVTSGPTTAVPAPTISAPVPVPATPTPDTATPSPSPAPTTQAPAPPTTGSPATEPPTTNLPQKKVAPQAKCGSLAQRNGRGGAAAQAKDCASRGGGGGGGNGNGNTRRRLKGRR